MALNVQHSTSVTHSSSTPLTHSDVPSYAHATSRSVSREGSPQLTPTQLEIHRRTIILRRLPFHITTADIITSIIKQFKLHKPENHITSCIQDNEDRRRFYLTLTTYEFKKQIQSAGFHVGDTHIKPQSGDISLELPYTPFDMSESDIKNIMNAHGTNINGRFKVDKNNIRIGGYVFTMDVRPNQTTPTHVNFSNHSLRIINRDSKKTCTFCHNSGHLQQHCKIKQAQHNNKMSNLEQIANIELQQQQEEEQQQQQLTNSSDNTPQAKSDIEINKQIPIASPSLNIQQDEQISNSQPANVASVSLAHVIIDDDINNSISISSSKSIPSDEPTSVPSTTKSTMSNESVPQVDLKCAPGGHMTSETPSPASTSPPAALKLPTSSNVPHVAPVGDVVIEPARCDTPQGKPTPARKRELSLTPDTKQATEPVKHHGEKSPLIWQLPQTTYKEHPNFPYKQPNLDTNKSLPDIFSKHAKKRFTVHMQDICEERFPDKTDRANLPEHVWKDIYIQCVRRVKADMWQTGIFQENWGELCTTIGCYKRYKLNTEDDPYKFDVT